MSAVWLRAASRASRLALRRQNTWIKPGAFGSRSTLGVLVDERSNLLWVCSNDMSGMGVPGPSSIPGSFLKGFDLATGEGKVSAALPGSHILCNDMTIAADGSIYVTNSRAPQILRLKPEGKELEVWLEDKQFDPPKDGAGLDGIAIGGDGNIYVNTVKMIVADLNAKGGELNQTNLILPEPCEFISKSLPACSVIRPTLTKNGGAGVFYPGQPAGYRRLRQDQVGLVEF